MKGYGVMRRFKNRGRLFGGGMRVGLKRGDLVGLGALVL